MTTKINSTWTDDHLPCVSFTHNNRYFEIWWTDPALYGKLDLVEDGDITIELALKKYPQLLRVIQDPTDVENLKDLMDDIEGDDKISFSTDAGWISWFKNGKPAKD